MNTNSINNAGGALLKRSEGLVLHAYPDPRSPLGLGLQRAGLWRQYLAAPIAREDMPAGIRDLDGAPWTIGYGDTLGVAEGDNMTKDEAEARLAARLDRDFVQPILAACTLAPTANQLAAMACLSWNIGLPAFLKSTVLRCHNRGDFSAAARAFHLFNKARGKEVQALVARRAAEAALYLEPEERETPQEMPQAVEPETKMTQSTINKGAAIAGGVSTITAIQQATEAVAGVKKDLDNLEAWIVPALLLAVVAACGYIIYERVQQRRKGFA